jgi:hypothetical protein
MIATNMTRIVDLVQHVDPAYAGIGQLRRATGGEPVSDSAFICRTSSRLFDRYWNQWCN